MRIKKIRGHNRIHKEIREWSNDYSTTNIKEYFGTDHRFYAKIRVHPWSGISLLNSETPEPKGKTKLLMLNGLLDIYESWKSQLDQLGKPYYLKIWLYEPHFSQSQVVYSFGDFIDFYKNTFHKPEIQKDFSPERYGFLKDRLKALSWQNHWHENHFDNTEVNDPYYEEDKKWFKKQLKKPHRTTQLEEQNEGRTELYSVKIGDVWIGGD